MHNYKIEDPISAIEGSQRQPQVQLVEQSDSTASHTADAEREQDAGPKYFPDDHGFRRIIRNFTPSMSNQRSELAEMTALYLIPIVAVVIAATSGGLVVGALPDRQNQLYTLVISYIFWGIGSPLSWIILTLYFLRTDLFLKRAKEDKKASKGPKATEHTSMKRKLKAHADDRNEECVDSIPAQASALIEKPQPRKKRAPNRPKKPFPFLSLPAEIRIKIYHYAVSYDYMLTSRRKRGTASGLLSVSRLIHSEAFEIFYAENVFEIYIGGGPKPASRKLLPNLKLMRQCYVKINKEKLYNSKDSRGLSLYHRFDQVLMDPRNRLECLLIELHTPKLDDDMDWRSDLKYMDSAQGIHLVEIVIVETPLGEVRSNGLVQRAERMMMRDASSEEVIPYTMREHRRPYINQPRLSIDLTGPMLSDAKKNGGWEYKKNDLYALFGLAGYASSPSETSEGSLASGMPNTEGSDDADDGNGGGGGGGRDTNSL
ncbi:MAG: hypothetical protein Q9167_006348 [Letrouitia subvulpina]